MSIRIPLLLLFATLIPALVAGMQFLERRDAEIAAARQDLAAAARRIAQDLRDTVRATAQLHYGLSRARDLDTQDRAACSVFLADVLKEHPQYTGILTITPKGDLFCDSLRTGRALRLTDRRYFQDALNAANPLAVEPAFGRLTGIAVLQIAYAARRETGEPKFVLLASLNLEKTMQSRSQTLPRQNTAIALVDGKGTLLTWHPDGEKLRGTSIADSPLFRFARERQGEEVREDIESGGVSRIWAASALPEFPAAGLHVLVGVSKQDLLAAANRNLGQALATLLVVWLLVFAGAWVLVDIGAGRHAARIFERQDAARQAAESALRKTEGVFQQLFESMPDPVISVNREGAIVRINSQAERVFGYNREEMLGQLVEILIPGRFRDRHVGLRGGYIAEPKIRPMGAGLDLYGQRKDGSEFAVEISLSPMETEEGLFAVSVIRDVTAQKEAEKAAKELSDELARSNTDLQQFAFAASHDLQEPLRAVAGCTQILQKRYADKLDARADELIEQAVQGATRMQSLVNDLLEFSRVGTRGRPLGRVDAGRSLEDALHNLAVAIRESGAVVTHDPMPEVLADGSQLALVFQNLVANAIKFRGERRPEIHVGAGRGPGEWRFIVRDNGVGIEPQYFERIFLIFQRLHTRRESSGTGIGLALCKRIVERHGGRIWVESEVGNGTTFRFTIAERS